MSTTLETGWIEFVFAATHLLELIELVHVDFLLLLELLLQILLAPTMLFDCTIQLRWPLITHVLLQDLRRAQRRVVGDPPHEHLQRALAPAWEWLLGMGWWGLMG